MGKPTGFMEYERETPTKRKIDERVLDYQEIEETLPISTAKKQAARCMSCGVPFCHSGCPLGNIIPEFNDAVYEQNWEYAYELLISTNNFPEFTGRICPAPCESSCVLGINKPPVTIEAIERFIIETAFEKGYVKPNPPLYRTGKKVAIIGSGPAGLAAAAQLNKAGHWVTVFERSDAIGGLLRYGIPDFKLDKLTIDRRLQVMQEEGITFKTNANVGVNIKTKTLLEDFDAILLCGGSTVPRDLPIKGRELKGVYFAMEFLSQQNKRVAQLPIQVDHTGKKYQNGEIWATDKHVVVIGGGDTGSDCVGTSNRHQAQSVTQIELMPMPPKQRAESTPWPQWPMMLRTSTSHEEGCERRWAIQTKEFVGDEQGNLKGLKLVEIEWKLENGRMTFIEIPNTEREIPCDLALLAMGFISPQQEGILNDLEIEIDEKGNVKAQNYQTNNPKVFAAGDMRRGQSLVVWAISEGREAAREVDLFLMGHTELEAKAVSMLNTQKLAYA
ncbi:MAG: glutamate synthase subunit beta [Thermoflexibacter sp.]|jgi:glutamate synthase (NADPH/NADH) small chain|nr:glutamate synthase subunit beta [Thermoflexibacter sp.]